MASCNGNLTSSRNIQPLSLDVRSMHSYLSAHHYQIVFWIVHCQAQNVSASCLPQVYNFITISLFYWRGCFCVMQTLYHAERRENTLAHSFMIFVWEGTQFRMLLSWWQAFPNFPFYVFDGRRYIQVSGDELGSMGGWVNVLSLRFLYSN